MCVLSTKVPIRKNSGNLCNDPRNTKVILVKEKQRYFLAHSWWRFQGGVHNFPKHIRPKVNVIARLESQLSYFEGAIKHVKH